MSELCWVTEVDEGTKFWATSTIATAQASVSCSAYPLDGHSLRLYTLFERDRRSYKLGHYCRLVH